LSQARVIGFQNARDFSAHLGRVGSGGAVKISMN
jgi:hypothetical protein